MLKSFPDFIKRSCFVDPVTFCSWEGDVCYNFVYKEPTNVRHLPYPPFLLPSSTASSFSPFTSTEQGIELLMRYYVGSEIGIANYIQRNFDWSANTLFFEEIPDALDPKKTMFFVGGGDSILSGPVSFSYFLCLARYGIRL